MSLAMSINEENNNNTTTTTTDEFESALYSIKSPYSAGVRRQHFSENDNIEHSIHEDDEDDVHEDVERDDDFGDDHNGTDPLTSRHESMIARMVQEETTPFSKMLSMLRSLREHLPGHDKVQEPSYSSRAAFDHHFIHPSLTSPPINRLDWCIDHLEEFVSKKYSFFPNTRDSMSKMFRQKITALDDNSEEFLQYLEENYIAQSVVRIKPRGHTSPKESTTIRTTEPTDAPAEAPLEREGSRSLFDMSQSFEMNCRSEGELAKLQQRKWISSKSETTPDSTSGQSQSVDDNAISPIPTEPAHARVSVFLPSECAPGESQQHGFSQQPSSSPRALPARLPRLLRIQRVRSAPVINPHPMTALPQFSPECQAMIADVSPWGLDVFRLDKVAGSRPLLALGTQLLTRDGVAHRLKINPLILARFLAALEDGYAHYPQILYHNNLHATDVLHSTYLLLKAPILAGAFTDLEVFSAILAAGAHDVGHPGVTNQFLMATQSPLAILYNDQAVLENHHAATTFKLMLTPEYNVLASLSPSDQHTCRAMIIEMIMNTDMARHFQFLNNFRLLVESKRNEGGVFDISQLRDEDRMLVLCAIVHCADLAGTTKPWPLCSEWCKRLLLEFFNQGDRESEAGLEVGPLHDRNKTNIAKSQVNFINFIALPLWEVWDQLVGGESEPLKLLKQNRDSWQRLAHEADANKAEHPL